MSKLDYNFMEKIYKLLEDDRLDDHSKLFFIKQVVENWNLSRKIHEQR